MVVFSITLSQSKTDVGFELDALSVQLVYTFSYAFNSTFNRISTTFETKFFHRPLDYDHDKTHFKAVVEWE